MKASKNYNPIENVEDDGLEIPEVGEWGIEKYNLVGRYCDIFTTSMSNKWKNLVYIDLFSSSGYAKIKSKNQIIKSSALIALSLPSKFTHYIFCEKDKKLLESLKKRVNREFPDVNTNFVSGDCNNKIDEIISLIPKYGRDNGVLSFCFIDPFALEIHFKTIKKLGQNLKMDFLMLVATGMAAKRNEQNYKKPSNDTIEKFLDNPEWLNEFSGLIDTSNETFTQFITKKLKQNMLDLGYQKSTDFHQVKYRLDGKAVSLYHLAFFSKNTKGNDFWNISKNYPNEQKSLF